MKSPPRLIAVFTTVASVEDARRLARALVEARLAACAQISAIDSCYEWEGVIQQAAEWRILFKTTGDRYPEVEAAIRRQHPYQLPAVYAVVACEAFGPYADWVVQGSSTPPAGGSA